MRTRWQYAHPPGEKGTRDISYAPVGDPALGPVAYPHRASAMELPQASLGHHWQDSTHIANHVVTAGVSYGKVRLEASGFYGREPDEARWNIDWAAINSWSTRLSVFPSENWTAQVSTGRLQDPEWSHTGDILRTTASIEYVRPAMDKNWWAASFIWGKTTSFGNARARTRFWQRRFCHSRGKTSSPAGRSGPSATSCSITTRNSLRR